MASQHRRDPLVWILLAVLAVVVVVPLTMMLFAMPMTGMMGWWSGGTPGMGPSPLWGIGMTLLFLAVILGVGYVLYRSVVGGQVLERDRALEELRTAYASGDLSDEEFERRRQRLQRDRD